MVNAYSADPKKIKEAMSEIGFREISKYFRHPRSKHIVEFPAGPLAIDDQPVRAVSAIRLATGTLKVISPTDCVRDRLAAYYFWNDQPSLEQAVLVARNKRVNMTAIRRWFAKLDMLPIFRIFREKCTVRKRAG